MKRNKGITLIALIITIIILLILAGIAIANLNGENGLIARAKQARNNTIDAQEIENAVLGSYEGTINSIIDGSRESVTISKEQYEAITQTITNYENLLQDMESVKIELETSNNERKELEEKIEALELTSSGIELEKIGEVNTSTSWKETNVPGGISQYKYLYFVFCHKEEYGVYNSYIMKVEEFKEKYKSDSNYFTLHFSPGSGSKYSYFYYNTDTSIYSKVDGWACKVYGIK